MQIHDLFRQAVVHSASDLHLIPNTQPKIRVDGQLAPMPGVPIITSEQNAALILQLLTEKQRAHLEQEMGLDFAFSIDKIRYRGNIFFQRQGLQGAFRIIPTRIPTPEELLLPPNVVQLADNPRGLILVTGPTGSGKSTTLACLINIINQRQKANIITIEDPIEFIFTNQMSMVSQREVGQHAPSLSAALRYILRQDPDVVMMGELRDYESIAVALTIAETGHLVISTLHTVDVAQTIDRIVDVFPSHQQQQVRTQLAGTLKAVIGQHLLPRVGGKGRVAAREIMIVTPAIANLIRQAKSHEIYSAIEMGANLGMITLGRSLAELVRHGLVDHQTASEFNGGPENNIRR